jgi:hypothetical protein
VVVTNKTTIVKNILAILSVVLVCTIFSCTKNNVIPLNKNPIVGLWVGTYKAVGDAVDSFYYSYDITSNGRMISAAIGPTNNSTSSAGPWQLSGTNFTATLTTLDAGSPLYVQAVTAVYDSIAGTISGQAVFTQGSGGNATFLLQRVP